MAGLEVISGSGGPKNPNADAWQVPDNSSEDRGEPDTYVEDPEEAHVMAIASDRNERNVAAWREVAKAGMLVPDSKHSPIRVYSEPVDGQTGVNSSYPVTDKYGRIPETRVVIIGEGNMAYSVDEAITAAGQDRREADRRANEASERYNRLKNL